MPLWRRSALGNIDFSPGDRACLLKEVSPDVSEVVVTEVAERPIHAVDCMVAMGAQFFPATVTTGFAVLATAASRAWCCHAESEACCCRPLAIHDVDTFLVELGH